MSNVVKSINVLTRFLNKQRTKHETKNGDIVTITPNK